VKVTITYEEEPKTRLLLSYFSFIESQESLKDYQGSFYDRVIEERRKAL
jgi:hypothetical protein